MHPTNQVVLDAVTAAGIEPRMVWLDQHARTAALAAEQIGCVADSVLQQLEQLCQLVGSSKEALHHAAERMFALRPDQN